MPWRRGKWKRFLRKRRHKRKDTRWFLKKKKKKERHKVEERPRGENIIQAESFYLDL